MSVLLSLCYYQAMSDWLERMEATLLDARAELTTDLGGHREITVARVWRGDVLVDWERDDAAGGCLLRPSLVRRLLALNATLDERPTEVVLSAAPRAVAALSREHARLAAGLGYEPAVTVHLQFDGPRGPYVGGVETYRLAATRSAARAAVILQLVARVQPLVARRESPRTSPAPS